MRPAVLPSSRRRPRPATRRARLLAERLEQRALLTITADPVPQFVAYTGVPERLIPATFTESDKALTAADFTATIDWGDGTTSAGDIAETADGTFSVSALKTYTGPGTYPIGPGTYPVTVTISSPVNGDAASTAEVDASLLDASGGGSSAGTTRGVAGGNQGHYVADYAAGVVLDYNYNFLTGGSPFITVPGPGGGASRPTGLALLPGATDRLVIVTADGTIAVWANPGVPGIPLAGQAATTVVDHSASGADYEGVTVGTIPAAGGGTESVIFVANFATGKVEAYDAQTFAPVDLGAGAFTDPTLPAGYAPFNLQDINGTVYVAFAEQSGATGQAVDGAGKGYLDAFDPSGHFLARFDTGGGLNAPSGIALAPSDLGVYAGHLLVANTGDGTITVLDPSNPSAPSSSLPGVLGKVAGAGGGPLVVDGLWGLSAVTYNDYGSTYTYLYASSAVGGGQLAGFYYNPTLARVSAQPTTGITNAPDDTIEFLGMPSHLIWLGQFVDATGAVDGSDAASLSVTIDWGDGSAPTAGSLTLDTGVNLPSGADYAISGTAPYTATGTYHATLTVATAGGVSYTHDFTVTVLDGSDPVVEPIAVPGSPILNSGAGATPPAITMVPSFPAVATAPASVPLGSFTGPIAAYTVAINWGDGSTPSFGQLTPAPTLPGATSTCYEISGSHYYKLAGTYTVTIDLLGPNGLSEFASTTADVAPSRLALAGNPVVFLAAQGQPLTAELGTFTFDGAASLPTSDFIANVDWRDGSPPTRAEVHLMLPPGGTAHPYYAVVATHTYRTAGNYAPLINVIAPDGESWWCSTPSPSRPTPRARRTSRVPSRSWRRKASRRRIPSSPPSTRRPAPTPGPPPGATAPTRPSPRSEPSAPTAPWSSMGSTARTPTPRRTTSTSWPASSPPAASSTRSSTTRRSSRRRTPRRACPPRRSPAMPASG